MTVPLYQPKTEFVSLDWHNTPIHIEYQWVGATASDHPVIVFLHEGLGSVSLWKDFPEQLCARNGFTGLVYSRYGYGRSTPRPATERWPTGFLHAQAHEMLPALLDALDVRNPWLFGHSDGATIALLHAACFPEAVSGVVVAAPHILVEDITIAGIEQARDTYLSADLRDRLSRHHTDPDATFWGWNNIWLDPAFRAWSIEDRLSRIRCPLLAVQGEDDEYGSLEQIRGIQRQAPQTRLLILPRCGHSPHRDQPEVLIHETARFIINAGAT